MPYGWGQTGHATHMTCTLYKTQRVINPSKTHIHTKQTDLVKHTHALLRTYGAEGMVSQATEGDPKQANIITFTTIQYDVDTIVCPRRSVRIHYTKSLSATLNSATYINYIVYITHTLHLAAVRLYRSNIYSLCV